MKYKHNTITAAIAARVNATSIQLPLFYQMFNVVVHTRVLKAVPCLLCSTAALLPSIMHFCIIIFNLVSFLCIASNVFYLSTVGWLLCQNTYAVGTKCHRLGHSVFAIICPGFGEVKKRVRTTAGGASGSVRNLRIREDTAKYLYNLDPKSAYYDPKSRSMREDPQPHKSMLDKSFAGDNFVR